MMMASSTTTTATHISPKQQFKGIPRINNSTDSPTRWFVHTPDSTNSSPPKLLSLSPRNITLTVHSNRMADAIVQKQECFSSSSTCLYNINKNSNSDTTRNSILTSADECFSSRSKRARLLNNDEESIYERIHDKENYIYENDVVTAVATSSGEDSNVSSEEEDDDENVRGVNTTYFSTLLHSIEKKLKYEDDEDLLFSAKVKLFQRTSGESSSSLLTWVDLGVGQLKFLRHLEEGITYGTVRIAMNEIGTFNTIVDHLMEEGVKVCYQLYRYHLSLLYVKQCACVCFCII